jgi:N-methylhydantoinase A
MDEVMLGVEVGGTFTDWVLVRGQEVVRTGKVMSTPRTPAKSVLDAVRDAAVPLEHVTALLHGSTLATNAVLERKGAPTALVTTRGFGDVLEIQRQARTRLFDLAYRHPTPVIPRDLVLEVEERLGPGGEVRVPLEAGDLAERLQALIDHAGVESVAISLLHAYADPAHERALAGLIGERFPDLLVTLSSDVLPLFREFERTSTCAISAYVKPLVARYTSRLEEMMREGGFKGHLAIVQANGGTVPASEIRRHAARMILSGPAAGVIGAVVAGRAVGLGDLLTVDMGGTSTDVCLVTGGEPQVTSEYKIGGLPLGLTMIDIATVGAGGGSIASVDVGGALKVGPESAGADPGPACYGKGGTAFTVTDANVVLGLLRPETFFGGRLTLSMEAADAALDALAEGLGMDRLDVAEGVVRLANATMAQAMRLVSVERGFDPRDYSVVAYGGAGPLHAAALAEELAVPRVFVPFNPGLLSAYGLLLAGSRQDFLQTRILDVPTLDGEVLVEGFRELERKAAAEFLSYGVPLERVELRRALDMRYAGQGYELIVEVDDLLGTAFGPEALIERFEAVHRQRYGHASGGDRVEVVNLRLRATSQGPIGKVDSTGEHQGGEPVIERGTIRHGGRTLDCAFCQRLTLPRGHEVGGPAVIEEPTATTFVPPGWRARVDSRLNLLMTREEA